MKKSKKFPAKQLMSLYENKNYQKVVSKIKQFIIDGMSDEKLKQIYINSLENLSLEHFDSGDIVRALRDIELIFRLSDNIKYKLLKLKYLCYLEKFEDAIEYANDLLGIKNSITIKKEILFYQILANIYSCGTINQEYLKQLTISKQNYALAIKALFEQEYKLALEYLNSCNPRLKIEKQNLKAIKAIITSESFENQDIKPLYKLLLFGVDKNLQNTKNTRENKFTILKEFKEQGTNKALENLYLLKEPIDEQLLRKQDNIKLVYNNIALLVEKKKNDTLARKQFLHNKDKLVELPDSIYLLIQIYKANKDNTDSCQKTFLFFKNYFLKHKDKLSNFNIKYIFTSIFLNIVHPSNATLYKQYVTLAHQYNVVYLPHIIQELQNPKLITNIDSIALVEQFFVKFDKINEMIIKDTIGYINNFKYIFYSLDENQQEAMVDTISTNSLLLIEVKTIDKKYENILFELLTTMSDILSGFHMEYFMKQFKNLNSLIEYFIDIFKYDKTKLSNEIKEFQETVRNFNKSDKKTLKKETFADMLQRLAQSLEDDDLDDFFEENIEEDLQNIYGEFKFLLKSKQNPFVALDNFPKFYSWFNNSEYNSIVFDLISEYSRYKTVTLKTIEKFFKKTDFRFDIETVRDKIPALLNRHSDYDYEIALKILEYIIDLKKDYETAWYLQWLYTYLDISYKNNTQQNKTLKIILERFIKIQQKKKFSTFHKKFEKVKQWYSKDDIEYVGGYEQPKFEF